jgi:hypothetical protein
MTIQYLNTKLTYIKTSPSPRSLNPQIILLECNYPGQMFTSNLFQLPLGRLCYWVSPTLTHFEIKHFNFSEKTNHFYDNHWQSFQHPMLLTPKHTHTHTHIYKQSIIECKFLHQTSRRSHQSLFDSAKLFLDSTQTLKNQNYLVTTRIWPHMAHNQSIYQWTEARFSLKKVLEIGSWIPVMALVTIWVIKGIQGTTN